MVATKVKITELENKLDPNKKIFEIDSTGRTHALKVDYDNGEYDLYVLYQNRFFKTEFKYESTILKYYYSNNLKRLVYLETINLVSSDNTYIRISDGVTVDKDEALDNNGIIKNGYITEAKYHESSLGDIISDIEILGLKRKFNIV